MNEAVKPGDVLAERYRLERPLGRGGMGEVWAGTHVVTLAPVAVKLLSAAVTGGGQGRRRFLQEAQAPAALDHPNVIRVIDAFVLDSGQPAIVMDRLAGEPLNLILQREETVSVGALAAMAVPVLDAIAVAHGKGLVHRDLKPANLFLARRAGEVVPVVLDFGLVKLMGSTKTALRTQPGLALGTPAYMAPEQARGEALGPPADVWAMGVVLYRALTGMLPIEGKDLADLIVRLGRQAVLPLAEIEPDLPSEVSSLVMSMLSKDPAARPSAARCGTTLRPYAKAAELARLVTAKLEAPTAREPRLAPSLAGSSLPTAPTVHAPLATAPTVPVPAIGKQAVGGSALRPGMTEVSVPAVTAPQATTAGVTAPQATTPGVTVPQATTPGVTVPQATTPGVTVPQATTPGVTVPQAMTPGVTVPQVSRVGRGGGAAATRPASRKKWWLLGVAACGLVALLSVLGLRARRAQLDDVAATDDDAAGSSTEPHAGPSKDDASDPSGSDDASGSSSTGDELEAEGAPLRAGPLAPPGLYIWREKSGGWVLRLVTRGRRRGAKLKGRLEGLSEPPVLVGGEGADRLEASDGGWTFILEAGDPDTVTMKAERCLTVHLDTPLPTRRIYLGRERRHPPQRRFSVCPP